MKEIYESLSTEEYLDFWDTFYELLILHTSSNYPDVMLPFLKENRASFLFFFVFVMIEYFLLTKVLLAFFYYHFKENLEAHTNITLKYNNIT